MRDTAIRSLNRDDVLKYSQTVCDGLRNDDDGYGERCWLMPAIEHG